LIIEKYKLLNRKRLCPFDDVDVMIKMMLVTVFGVMGIILASLCMDRLLKLVLIGRYL